MPESIVIPQPNVDPSVELVTSNPEELSVAHECDVHSSSHNISFGSDINTDQNQTCIKKIKINVFLKEIKFLMYQNKKLLVPEHNSVIDEDLSENLKTQEILNKAALVLKKSVLQAEKKKLPNKLSVQDLMNVEVLVPEDLSQF
ncbi:hypothetical protein WA026_022909 [Henosepilachna vigintioctopunctata]|uniref:Uncharacterized protein n=1 Tax=Henosepilachna vigintioctopunctata TaxID=420089 RepID=A0AAW1TZF7_9CUCU